MSVELNELKESWNKFEQERKHRLARVGERKIMLNPEGIQQHNDLKASYKKQLLTWFVAGNAAGFALSKLVPFLPISNLVGMRKRRCERVAYLSVLAITSACGFSISRHQFQLGQMRIVTNPALFVDEPDN